MVIKMMQAIRFGILLAGILFIRKAAWKRISRLAQYSIWIFAAFFLLSDSFLPIRSPFSIENMLYSIFPNMEQAIIADYAQMESDMPMAAFKEALSAAASAPVPMEQTPNMENDPPISQAERSSEKPPSEEAVGSLGNFTYVQKRSLQSIAAVYRNYARYGISFLLLVIVAISNIRFYIFCRKNRIFYKEIPDWNMNVYFLKGIPSPFLSGRSIYVDKDRIQNEKMLRHIIAHEYCHFRHKDIFWTFLRTFCLALHWYNPFVWLANGFVKRDCELACDEAALLLLGAEEKTEYGYTLLTLLNRSGINRKSPSVVTMGSNMKRIKERITMISSTKKYRAFTLWLTILCITLLTGCSFAKKAEPAASAFPNLETDERCAANPAVFSEEIVSDNLSKSAGTSKEEEKDDRPNKYYNVSAKYYDGYTYIASEAGLYRVKDGSNDWQLIYSDAPALGTIAEGYLFFYSYPENMEDAAIMALNLSTGELSVSLSLGENIYSWREMYYENGSLYIETASDAEIASFEIKSNGILEEKETYSVAVPDYLQNAETNIRILSPIITRSEGFSGTFYYKRKETDELPDELYFYTDDAQMYRLEGITDAMITAKGIIGRDIDRYNDVYVCDIYTGEKRLLYPASQNNNAYFGYNTYDNHGVYGLLQENDDSFYIARISWEGALEKLFPVENADRLYGIHVQMSVVDGWIYYYNPQSEKMERREAE